MWPFLSAPIFTRVYVLQTVNDLLRRDDCQPDATDVRDLGGQFVKSEDEWEEQKEDEDDNYYDVLGHAFGNECVLLELICPPLNRFDEMVERFVSYRDQADMYDRVVVTVGVFYANVLPKVMGF